MIKPFPFPLRPHPFAVTAAGICCAFFSLAPLHASAPALDNIKQLQQDAAAGKPEAEYQLGKAYALGNGVSKDPALAFKWFRAAAEQGHARAQADVGMAYQLGSGVKMDWPLSVKWYRKSAEQGDYLDILLTGIVIPRDPMEALKWYKYASASGRPEPIGMVGYIYSDQWGLTRPNYAEALKWLTKAADMGSWDAQIRIGQMYFFGLGVKRDPRVALDWFRKSADRGYSIGECEVGDCYLDGDPEIKPDPVQAYYWLSRSARQKNDTAHDFLKRVTLTITPEQQKQGDRLLQAYLEGKKQNPGNSAKPAPAAMAAGSTSELSR
jgi:hypothetical protein